MAKLRGVWSYVKLSEVVVGGSLIAYRAGDTLARKIRNSERLNDDTRL